MHLSSYPFSLTKAERYIFVSKGKRDIKKVVEFMPSRHVSNLFNVAFGDLLPDDSIDDLANSNNGDIVKVLTTVILIIEDFIAQYPKSTVIFTGSTEERTIFYERIIKRYYEVFKERFTVNVIIVSNNSWIEVPFNPAGNVEYLAFLIKKNLNFNICQ